MSDKTKTLTQVINEVLEVGPKEVANFDSKLAEAKINLKEKIAKGYKLPLGVESHPLEDFDLDYSIQRDVRETHCLNIAKHFDPRVCAPVSAVRRSGSKRLAIFDGQHRAVTLGLLGYTEIPVTIVETDEPAFDAIAFEIVNDTGILKAGTEEIHRVLLHRFEMGETENDRVITARKVQDIFDELKIDLEPKRVRKSPGKCGPNPHYFSHFDYAYKGYKLIGDKIKDVLSIIKDEFGDEKGKDAPAGEINQGLYIGLVKLYHLTIEANRFKYLPENWMKKMLQALKKGCGQNASLIHTASKRQWQYSNPVSWDAPIAMAHILREVYLLEDGEFEPSYTPNVNLGILDGNIDPESTETKIAFGKYKKVA
jgi:hypothetical protein